MLQRGELGRTAGAWRVGLAQPVQSGQFPRWDKDAGSAITVSSLERCAVNSRGVFRRLATLDKGIAALAAKPQRFIEFIQKRLAQRGDSPPG